MYYLKVCGHFDAAHYLRNYSGKCANMHGHRWQYAITLKKEGLNDLGMVIDFSAVKSALKPIVEALDHTVVNDWTLLGDKNPTAENLAYTFYNCLKKLPVIGMILEEVTIWESPGCSCTYRSN